MWRHGNHEAQLRDIQRDEPKLSGITWEEYEGNAPTPGESFRPEFTEEPTWYQVYENVSEGCPITPPFETKEEMVEYLIEVGDSWDGPVSRNVAEKFAESGHAPSGVFTTSGGFYRGIESSVLKSGKS